MQDEPPTTKPRIQQPLQLSAPLPIPQATIKRKPELDQGGDVNRRREMTISSTTITPVHKLLTKKGQQVDVSTNEEEELRLDDPLLAESLKEEFPKHLPKQAMNTEMKSMKDFKVYQEVFVKQLTDEQFKKLIKTRWVLRWKGDEIRARLVAKGYSQEADPQETYASTPPLLTL